MTYTRNGAGRGGQGVEPRDKRPNRRRAPRDPVAQEVHRRAFELVRAVWAAERWKSSITTKVPSYLEALLFGRKAVAPPSGVPLRIVRLVQRSIAQACLEQGATGLKVQEADWYEESMEAARQVMPPS